MPFLDSLPDDASPIAIYQRHPEIFDPWSLMSEAVMNGPSPFSKGERELFFSYAAGAAGCEFVCVAHSEVAYAHGIPRGTVEALVRDGDAPGIEPRLRPVLALVRKLAVDPSAIRRADIDAVLAAGWNETAVIHAIAAAGRAAFMHRMASGLGFIPMRQEVAAKHALRRIEKGYVNIGKVSSSSI